MLKNNSIWYLSKFTKKVPLTFIIIVPFIIQILAVVGLITWLSYRNGQKAVEDLTTQYRSEITTRIHQHLTTHTTLPYRANQHNVDIIQLGLLDLDNINTLQQHLWKQIQLFSTVNYMGIATQKGNYVGTQLLDNNSTLVEILDNSTEKNLKIWETKYFIPRQQLKHIKPKQKISNFNPKQQPWYLNAAKVGKPVWSKAYFSSRRAALSINHPIYNQQQQLIAVTTADIDVLDISDFLRSLKIGISGQAFIMETSSGLMVATSTDEKPYQKNNFEQFKPYKVQHSYNDLTSAAANRLIQHFADLTSIKDKQDITFINNNQRYYLQVKPFNDKWGLDWLIVVAISDKDFMEHIDQNTYSALALCFLALIVSIIFGIINAQWIIQPLVALNQNIKNLAAGEWKHLIKHNRQDEIGELANSFSSMITQLQTLFTTLEDKNQDLQRLDQLKDEFLANTSHELRTPLNGIIGIAESLLEGTTGKLSLPAIEELSIIVANGKRLSNLVNDILDLSQHKHSQITLQLNPINIKNMIKDIFKFCHSLLGTKDIQLVNAIPDGLSRIYIDDNRVQQILHNLINNAIKFTESGQIKISAQVIETEAVITDQIHIDQIQNINLEQQMMITVSDTGIGIPTDKTAQIFKSYEQLDDISEGGTGLGLSISKQLVLLHGGQIWVESTVNVGSRFMFTLPICNIPESDTQEQQISSPDGNNIIADIEVKLPSASIEILQKNAGNDIVIPDISNSTESANFTILIVDDEPINLHVLSNYLSLYHYNVIQVHSGLQALEALEEKPLIDLILLDIMMPRMTGYEVIRQIRLKQDTNELPVILLTAKNQLDDLVKGLDMGANDYLVKPISKTELLARIKTHLHIKELHKELEHYSHHLEEKVEERTYKLSEAKQAAEQALEQLKATQEQLVESAKMAELGNLVAGVAHEINTPIGIGVTAVSRLNSLTSSLFSLYKSGAMKRANLDKYLAAVTEGSDLTLKNLMRAAELIQSFKQVAVDQAGEQKRIFNLKEYLREILLTLNPQIKRTKYKVSINCQDEIIILNYPGIFSQIFTNFIMNSLIHGFKGRDTGEITILVEKTLDNELTISYKDDGNGIPKQVINKIFDPFFTTNRQQGGSGLGLNIVYNLVSHKLQGTIICQSIENEGTNFIIKIPVQFDKNKKIPAIEKSK